MCPHKPAQQVLRNHRPSDRFGNRIAFVKQQTMAAQVRFRGPPSQWRAFSKVAVSATAVSGTWMVKLRRQASTLPNGRSDLTTGHREASPPHGFSPLRLRSCCHASENKSPASIGQIRVVRRLFSDEPPERTPHCLTLPAIRSKAGFSAAAGSPCRDRNRDQNTETGSTGRRSLDRRSVRHGSAD